MRIGRRGVPTVDVHITGMTFDLDDPPTSDTYRLAAGIACKAAQIEHGKSGRCDYTSVDTLPEYLAVLTGQHCKPADLVTERRDWLEMADGGRRRVIGIIHRWVAPGDMLPPWPGEETEPTSANLNGQNAPQRMN